MHSRVKQAAAIVLAAMLLSACGTSRAYRRGMEAARTGDWDLAVQHYTRAVQEYPDRPEYKIALERAQQTASNTHFDAAKVLDEKGDLENAIAEYRRAIEFNPSNRQAVARRAELERIVRERSEANRPKSPLDAMRAQARRQTEGPLLNPTSRTPLKFNFVEAAAVDVLNLLGSQSGINVVFEPTYRDAVKSKPVSLTLDGVSFEEGLNLVMTVTGSWYKVLNPRTIFIMQDTPQMRTKYEEQVVRTFYISHADPTELNQVVQQVSRLQTAGAAPVQTMANKTANTIVVRGSAAMVNIIEKIIQANDRPRAEIVVDVEILEVSRVRAKQLGLNLGQYEIGTIFSPETRPGSTGGGNGGGTDPGTGTGGGSSGGGTSTGDTGSGNTFNLNTISQGISTADFYMSVPSAIFKFLASDSHTRQLAKPQLRGAEGEELSLNLGNDVPVPQTVFGGIASGGINTVPIQSFTYRTVGIRVKMKPRVTYDNEILLEIEIESSTVGSGVTVAGQSLPSFGTRNVKTKLRLREGESNLLAGLLQENDRRALQGIPGVMNVPGLKDILGSRNNSMDQTDIVMLLTPRIVRTHELTQDNLNPIYIGSASNVGLTGPTPVIAAPDEPGADVPAGAVPGAPGGVPPPGAPLATAPPLGGQPTPPPAGGLPNTVTPGTPPSVTSTPGLQPAATPPRESTAPTPATPGAPIAPPAAAQIIVATPGPEFRVGGGPYTVPISISGASRLSVVSLTLTYNPAVVRVRSVQEGTFLRQGGMNAAFAQKDDAASGRLDVSIARNGDSTGASGVGLLAAVLFDAVAPGSTALSVSGVATGPDGTTIPLTFTPASVTVR